MGEGRPIGGIRAVHGDRDGRGEHFGGVPETWRHIASDKESRSTSVESFFKDLSHRAVEPIGKEISWSRLDIGEEFGEEHIELFAAEVRGGLFVGGI